MGWSGGEGAESPADRRALHGRHSIRRYSKIAIRAEYAKIVGCLRLAGRISSNIPSACSILGMKTGNFRTRWSAEDRESLGLTCLHRPLVNCESLYKLIRFYKVPDRPRLFNVRTDPCERNNLFSALPEKAEALGERLDAYLRSVGARLTRINGNFDPSQEVSRIERGGQQRRDNPAQSARRRGQSRSDLGQANR